MKILVATGIYPPEVGGPATYASLMLKTLTKRGIEVKVLPFRYVRKYPIFIRHIVYFLKVIKESRGCNIVFTQDTISTGVPVVLASIFTGKKVVLRVPGDYVWEQACQRFKVTDSIDDFQNKKYSFGVEVFRSLQRFSVKRADLVITPSNYFNKLVSGWLSGKKKVLTVYNGIDTHIDFEKKEKFSDKTIITAGRLVPWKGFDTLIKNLSHMPGWHLRIAGDGPDRSRLQGLVERLNLTDRVEFLSEISREKLFAEIYRSNVFALLTTFESFSFQIVEAMFAGTPVIASKIGNLDEIIENGVDGVLIDPNDIEEFIKQVKRLDEDSAYRAGIVEKAKLKADKFSFERTAEKLVALFKELMP